MPSGRTLELVRGRVLINCVYVCFAPQATEMCVPRNDAMGQEQTQTPSRPPLRGELQVKAKVLGRWKVMRSRTS